MNMTEWYRLGGRSAWLFADDRRPAGLGGIDCDHCGKTWAILGGAYPTLRCDQLPPAMGEDAGPVPFETYKKLERTLARIVEDGRPIHPGLGLGPLCAPVKREPPRVFEDYSSLFLGTEVAKDPAIKALGLRMVRSVVSTARSGRRFVLYEVEAWPVATRSPRSLAAWKRRAKPPCRKCGFQRTAPYDIARPQPLLRSSLDGLHIARLDEAPGTQFVSGALRDALQKHRPLRTLEFVRVKVVDE